MKKYIMAALFALAFAVPGAVNASSLFEVEAPASGEMDPALVEAILRAATEHCQYDYCNLASSYESGEVTIEKTAEGYQISDGGGIIAVLMDDEL